MLVAVRTTSVLYGMNGMIQLRQQLRISMSYTHNKPLKYAEAQAFG
jgi:hypothetical protein